MPSKGIKDFLHIHTTKLTLAKPKAKKQTKGRPVKRGLPWFAWLAIVLGVVAVVALIRTSPASKPASLSHPSELRAAIIDQLHSLQPNVAFISNVTAQLEDYGFEVDPYQADSVTVDLYRRVPGHSYELIIFRAHCGLLGSEGEAIYRTCLFTNEPCRETKHVTEQLTDQLAMARIDQNHPWVFAIGDRFVTQTMEGQFDNTIIIMMGCFCLYLDDLAQAFIGKGASAYLAWDATVDLGYVDEATPYLIELLCEGTLTLEEAVGNTMKEKGPDPNYGALLKYHPQNIGNRTVAELLH